MRMRGGFKQEGTGRPRGEQLSRSEAQEQLQWAWSRAYEGRNVSQGQPQRALSARARGWGSQRGLGWKNDIVTQLYT